MDDFSNSRMIVQLQSGDIKAFDCIYAKYHQALYRNILSITRNREIAEDILQEVFITLWERRSDLKKEKSLAGWLFVISFNKSVNYMKKELGRLKKRNALPLNTVDDLEEKPNVNKEEWRYELLQRAVKELSPQKQKAFVLCKLKGKTYKEAAEELNISKYTVKEYLSSGMSVVKNFIEKHAQALNYIDIVIFILIIFN